jgi:hypothetical protein
MDCREVQDQLIEFYEDQLDRKDAEHMRGHLAICPLCREELSSVEKVIVGLKSQRLPDPGEVFWRGFPKRVREAFWEGRGAVRDPILPRLWEGFYRTTRWLPFSKPVSAAVSIVAIVLILAGLLFFKAGWFWTGSRGIGEEIVEEYFGGMGAVVSPFAPVIVENLSLHQLNDISGELIGWLDGMGSSGDEILKRDGLLQEEEVLTQLEGLDSKELDFVYDALKTRYRKSSTSLSILGAKKGKITFKEGMV